MVRCRTCDAIAITNQIVFPRQPGPGFPNELAADRFRFCQGDASFIEQPGIFYSQAHLVSEQAEHLNIVTAKRTDLSTLHIQRADDPPLAA